MRLGRKAIALLDIKIITHRVPIIQRRERERKSWRVRVALARDKKESMTFGTRDIAARNEKRLHRRVYPSLVNAPSIRARARVIITACDRVRRVLFLRLSLTRTKETSVGGKKKLSHREQSEYAAVIASCCHCAPRSILMNRERSKPIHVFREGSRGCARMCERQGRRHSAIRERERDTADHRRGEWTG